MVREYTLTATSIAISIIGNGGIVVPSIVIQSSHNLCQDEGARVRWAKGLGHPLVAAFALVWQVFGELRDDSTGFSF